MKKSVLLIEDDEEQRKLMRTLLEGVELTVEEAGDGGVALKLLEGVVNQTHAGWDLILLDLDLPVVSGNALLRLVAKTDSLKAIPIVVISGASLEDETRNRGMEQAAAYIEKPPNRELLLGIIGHLLHGE